MAGASGYKVTLSAVDQVTGVITTLNTKLAAANAKNKASLDRSHTAITGFLAPVTRLGAGIGKLGDTAGLGRLTKGFANVKREAVGFFQGLGQVNDKLVTITGVASVAGIVRMASAWAESTQKLSQTGRILGMSAGQLARFQGAADLAGSSGNAMTAGLENLNQTLYDAVGGRAPEAVKWFNLLGVKYQDGAGHARDLVAVNDDLFDAISKMKDPMNQLAAGTAVYGGAFRDMLPFVVDGAKGLHEYEAAAGKYLNVTKEGEARAKNFNRAQAEATLAIRGLGNTISSELAPIITPLLHQFADWIALNREFIATGIKEAFGDLSSVLKGLEWAANVTGLTNLTGAAATGTASIEKWHWAMDAVMSLMAGSFAVTAAKFAGGPLMLVTKSVAKLAWGFSVALGEAMTAGIASLLAGEGAVSAFSAVLLANPATWFIGGVVAIGLAGYELWNHWKDVTSYFKDMWTGLRSMFDDNTGYIRTAVEVMFPLPMLIIGHWGGIKTFFSDMWVGIKEAFDAGWSYVEPIIGKLKAGVDFVANSWLGKKLGYAASAVGGAVSSGASAVAGAASSVIGAAPGVIANAAGSLDRAMGFGSGSSGNGAGPMKGSKATPAQWAADLKQLQGFGWTRNQAAGILGSTSQESNGNSSAVGDGGTAYGLQQWHPDRQADFAKWAGHDIHGSTHAEQIGFINYELHNKEARAGRELASAQSVGDSAHAVRKYYERPKDAFGYEDGWRTSKAWAVLGAAQGAPAEPPPTGGAAQQAAVNGKINISINGNTPGHTVTAGTDIPGANIANGLVQRAKIGELAL